MALELDLFRSTLLAIHLPTQVLDLTIGVPLFFVLLLALSRYRHDLRLDSARRFGFLAFCLLLGLGAPFVLRMQPAGALLSVPLLACLPIAVAALWLGRTPALLVGLGAGAAYAATLGLTWTHALEGAWFGLCLGCAFQQRRRGLLFAIARQPAALLPLAALAFWPLPLYRAGAYLFSAAPLAADPLPMLATLSLLALAAGLFWGAVLQVARLLIPARSLASTAVPAARPTLAGRLLARLLPAIVIVGATCVAAASFVSVGLVGLPPASVGALLIVLAIAFTLLSVATVILVHRELRPLGSLVAEIAARAFHELTTPLPADAGRRDEIGQLADAVQRMLLAVSAGIEQMARLVQVSQAISARAGLAQTLPLLLRAAAARSAGLCLVDETRGAVQSFAHDGDLELPAAVEGSIERLSRQVWRSGTETVLPHVQASAGDVAREDLSQSDVRALVVFPMRREGRVVGTLWAAWDKPRQFSPLERQYLAALANLAGVMVENQHLAYREQVERQRLQALLAGLRDGVLVTDARGRLELANSAAERLLNFDFKTNRGHPFHEFLDDRRIYPMLRTDSHSHGPAAIEIEQGLRRLHVSVARILAEENGDGVEVEGWVFVLRDVTEQRQAEAAEAGSLGRLVHAMATPLQCVRGFAAELSSAGPTNPTQDAYIKKILKGADDLNQLIEEHLKLRGIASGQGITRTPCQLVNIAAKVADIMSTYIEGKGLTLHTDFAPNLPKIIGDPDLLEHAIRNLVDNALKYTNAPGWIKVAVRETPTAVVVTVSDSGIGIPSNALHSIFEPGFRVQRKETIHIRGTGNGLAIVKAIVEQHGGQVWVESQLGVGSAFHIALQKERRIADLLGEEEGLPPGFPTPAPQVSNVAPARKLRRSEDPSTFL